MRLRHGMCSALVAAMVALPVIIVADAVATAQQPSKSQAGQTPGKGDKKSEQKQDKDPAVERTRKTVKMLDGIYKNAIVIVTTNYVTEKSDVPAGKAFKQLFQAAHDNEWHDVRLLDASGDPYEPENVAKTDFEKRAIERIKKGEAYVDEVMEKNGKRYLQAATAIPVVMKKCVLCHENYENVPAGQAIGALGYVVPIE